VVPLTLGIIALLLYLTFGTVAETAIVMLSLPFALVGGVWIMWLLDYNLSIAVAVGFIALAGVAAETGVVMLIYLDHAWQDAAKARSRPDRKSTRLNCSHVKISYAVFCLKKKREDSGRATGARRGWRS